MISHVFGKERKLVHTDTLYESWMEDACRIFGKDAFWNRIKFHMPTHLRQIVTNSYLITEILIDHHDESQVLLRNSGVHELSARTTRKISHEIIHAISRSGAEMFLRFAFY